MYGGPRFTVEGEWMLAVAPFELYLERGERAIVFLRRDVRDAPLLQRAHEAIKIEDGHVASREGYAWGDTFGDTEESVLSRIEQAVREVQQ
jgi:hypothetical protein